jgi:hypothetical protein
MAIPLIPLIAGAAVGAAATYLLKDPQVKDALRKSGEKALEGVGTGISALGGVLGKVKGHREAPEEGAEATGSLEPPPPIEKEQKADKPTGGARHH